MFFNRYRYRPSLQLCLSNTWQEKGRTGERADEEEGSSLGFLAFMSFSLSATDGAALVAALRGAFTCALEGFAGDLFGEAAGASVARSFAGAGAGACAAGAAVSVAGVRAIYLA